jgi:ppGpp synthetase/RelA/SpoT-type nucleotidyltranferase
MMTMPRPWTTARKTKRLIARHFPWGAPGFPAKPATSDPAELEQIVEHWISQRTLRFGSAALGLAARVQPILREMEADASPRRLLARLDCSSHVKSPSSILEKMIREWDPEQGGPTLGFGNFVEELCDLGRFRIVANFLSDAERIAEALERPYTTASVGRLTPAQQLLRVDYSLDGNRLVDLIHLDPAARRAGVRCLKGIFRPLGLPDQLAIEVQVQTLLQEAWDKKDHFLVYEPRRRGDSVDPSHEREIFAMSELLYVADLTFDRLRGEILNHGRRPPAGRRAPSPMRGKDAPA